MIVVESGVIVGSCYGGSLSAQSGGSGTILTGNNSVNVNHGLGMIPNWAVATPTNDAAQATGLKVSAKTATYITVAYPIGVTQPEDGTFDFEVGL